MTRSSQPADAADTKQRPTPPARGATMETVLAAWHDATVRLERTHESLREEVGRLTAELESKNRELARKERLADLGQMASHVAHEVRNNLVPLALYMSLLKRRLGDDPGSMEILAEIESAVSAMDVTVNDLLHFTSDRDPQRSPVRIRRLVEDVLGALAPQMSAQSIHTDIDVPATAVVWADQDMLRRAVFNLTLNAVDVMPEGGQLVVTSYDGPAGFELEVADSGPGLSDDARRRAFEPFFTTKSGGTGLGLAIVYRVAESHGGDVTAVNCPEGGAAFTLRFPRRAMEAAA